MKYNSLIAFFLIAMLILAMDAEGCQFDLEAEGGCVFDEEECY
jgi:hypothetical protein